MAFLLVVINVLKVVRQPCHAWIDLLNKILLDTSLMQ